MLFRTIQALTLTLAALTIPACTSNSATPSATVKAGDKGKATPLAAPLSESVLRERLLDEDDLGEGYIRRPETTRDHDDVTVSGCPAMENLGEAAAGGGFDFPHEAKATFTYTGTSNSEITEELYSDTADKLSQGLRTIFGAMASCPEYQVVVGSTPIDMSTRKTSAPDLGDEQRSQLLTFTVGAQSSVIKQTAIRTGTTLVVISGSPGLVDSQMEKAHDKAASTS